MKRFNVIWDDEAIKNHNEIWMYIAKDSVHYADKVSEEIEDSIERLISNPLLGPEEEILKRFRLGYRYIVHSHYKIIYRVLEYTVSISAIFDTRQKMSKLKKIVKKR